MWMKTGGEDIITKFFLGTVSVLRCSVFFSDLLFVTCPILRMLCELNSPMHISSKPCVTAPFH